MSPTVPPISVITTSGASPFSSGHASPGPATEFVGDVWIT